MPLVRFEVRNEYGLGTKELYGTSICKDDPKAILNGVAVSGLVGILRQLGDLAEFAAEIFHGLQEEVMTTASRSHKLIVRVQNVEAALPSLEKAVYSQTNHIHFAYTTGTDWHPNLQTSRRRNRIVHSYLPAFIMDSYEECRDPPSVHLLDKFDIGGPGACLKRYSDPSFFKKALASSDLANGANIQAEKKVRQTKKKGVQQRNVVPHVVAVSQQNSRRFDSTLAKNSNGKAISMSRSEPEDRSISFDSSRFNYIDCAFEATSCTSHKDQEHHVLKSSYLKQQCNDTLNTIHPREKDGEADDVLPHPDQGTANSSGVTWDEKTEILKPKIQKSIVEDQRTSELISTSSDQNKLESETTNSCESEDVMYKENRLESLTDGILSELDDSESEYYMDALNTTASEVETDAEKQTKIGVELPFVNLNNTTDFGINMLTERKGQSAALSDAEPCIRPGFLNLTESFEDPVFPKPPQFLCTHSNSYNVDTGLSKVTDLHDIPGVNGCESSSSYPLSSGLNGLESQASLGEKIISSVCHSQESIAEISGKRSIQLWTNGSLLGLAPSKPSDLGEHGLSSDNIMVGTPCDERISHVHEPDQTSLRSNEETAKLHDTVIPNSGNDILPNGSDEFSTSYDKQVNLLIPGSSLKISSTLSESKFDKSKDSVCSTFSNAHEHGSIDTIERGLTDAKAMNLRCDFPVVPDVRGSARDCDQETKSNSSNIFLPTYRSLVNSFQKKVTLSHDETSERSSVEKRGFTEPLSHGSPTNSISSSPPLEHMRISHYPVDGSESSKLKLNFHDGHHFRENSKDVIFPSFQLFPQPFSPFKDVNFGSDDDTFSRSSEYMSDELLSELSESNSEQWACGRAPGSEDKDIYHALHRFSSAESISKSSDIEEINHESINPDDSFNSPDNRNGKSIHNDSLINLSNRKDLPPGLQSPDKAMPPPPPLPPLQWRAMNPHVDLLDDKQGCISEAFSNQCSQQAPISSMSQQAKTTLLGQLPHGNKTTPCPPESKKEEQKKLNVHIIANQAQSNKILEEKEDFLHQIRSKSFSLKRTVTARPAFTPGPIADIKVAAILQKANAIRQAFVGSDEEDSEDWSDD
ncbi:Scar-like protein [Thalictrum thalictroides]|uniref:Protein SCAR n=1 Tax=Thalictrum thalictroides TaxID=46969 RepID=A0A7J6XBQ7_THATH|nr:Scar-like protein [Thalictrum thalictroides]